MPRGVLDAANVTRLVGDGSGEDGGEGGGELRVVFAEVLGGDEEVVVAGRFEPVADGGPEVAGDERVDEAQLAERARRRNDGHELEDGLDVGGRLGVAGDAVFLPFRRRIDGRLEVKELPSGLMTKGKENESTEKPRMHDRKLRPAD